MSVAAPLERLVRRLSRNCAALNRVLEEARETYPDALLYLDGTANLHLLKRRGADGNPDESESLGDAHLNACGGDW